MFNKIRLGYPGGFHDKECGPEKLQLRINRTCLLNKNFPKKIIPEAIKLAHENLEDLQKILEWNEQNGIKVFRIGSEIFPHISNWRLLETDILDFHNLAYDIEIFADKLKSIGEFANKNDHRLTFHPGPFTILNTPKHFVLVTVMRDLWWHTKFIEIMGTINSSLTLHIGGVYDDRQEAMQRFVENFTQLPQNIQKLIILENDENNFCAEHVLNVSDMIFDKLNIRVPICFDYFHYCCWNIYTKKDIKKYPRQKKLESIMPLILSSWGTRRPKFHLSEQQMGKALGTHSFFIKKIPKELQNLDIDLMLESRCKELTLLNLIK